MKPVKNKETSPLFICIKYKNCRNNFLFGSGRPCGHNIPHIRNAACREANCGEERGEITCVSMEEVLK